MKEVCYCSSKYFYLAWKRLFTSRRKIGVLGLFEPLNGIQYQLKPKMHTFAWARVIWAIKRENWCHGNIPWDIEKWRPDR